MPDERILKLDVRIIDDQVFQVDVDRSFWNAASAFGGWVAAVVATLLKDNPEFRGEILTQQMNFMRPVSVEEIDLTIQLLARRTTIDFWRVEVHDLDQQLLVTAELTAGIRRPGELTFESTAPADAHDPGELMELTELHPKWTAHFEQVMVDGEPFSVCDEPRTLVRARPLREVAFDTATLVMLCDTPMPRTFFATTELVFASTLSLAIYTYASDDQLAAVGHNYVLVEANSAVIRNATVNQEVRVRRNDGLLLATSYQTAIYRPASILPNSV